MVLLIHLLLSMSTWTDGSDENDVTSQYPFTAANNNGGNVWMWSYATNGWPDNYTDGTNWFSNLEPENGQEVTEGPNDGSVIRRAWLWSDWTTFWGTTDADTDSVLNELDNVLGD